MRNDVGDERATGTLTFLFTDLEGSTRLWERFPQAMVQALKRHDAILRATVEDAKGQVVKTTGDGFMAVFSSVSAAVTACVSAQRRLIDEPWADTAPLKVRMGLHVGDAEQRVGDFFGPTVNRAARVMAAAHGGQVLLSAAAAALAVDELPAGSTLRDLGEHRLKDLGRPEHLFQLVVPGLARDFPPLATLNSRPNNLPTDTSTFVGRDAELATIRDDLHAEAVRLLTLTGPGGTGKTRLALRVAAELIDRFDDGVFFVDLSAARDTATALATIARTIGVSESTGRSLLDDVVSDLRHQHMLLLLDNFEQVTAAAPALVELLSACPALKLLVTSREALHVRGEHLFPVPPLSLPAPAMDVRSATELVGYEAVQLFVDRAQAVQPGFQLTDANAAAVADICWRLDGLPLAIELATARLRLFSPEVIRERLGRRLELLRGGARDLPVRQQTLRATIDWSYQLLDPTEQRLLQLLSVFSGARFDAVEAVVADVEELTGVDPVDGSASLLDKSLIRQAETGQEEPRLVMLETIREYVAERLEDNPEFAAAVRRAHAAYFAEFAHAQRKHLTGQLRQSAVTAMADDIDNLRLAWAYWVAHDELDDLNKLVESLWLVYDARGWYHALTELTTDLLKVLSAKPSTPERATQELTLRAGFARALMAAKGFTADVERAYAEALRLFQGQQSPKLFPVLRSLASFYNFSAAFDKSNQVAREILRLAEQEHDPGMAVDGHLFLGVNSAFRGDLHAGLHHLDTAIVHFRSEPYRFRSFGLGNNPGVACYTTSAFLLWLLGHPDRSRQRADDAVALAHELQHPFTLAYALFHSGFVHLWRREPELAKARAQEVLQVVEDHDFPIWRAVGTCLLGAADAAIGNPLEGLTQIDDGLQLYQGLTTPPVFWPLMRCLQAGAQLSAGKATEALPMVDEALETVTGASVVTLLPEFRLLRGDVLLALPTSNAGEAEACFRQAYDDARRIDARMSQLRAASRLCRLWRDEDKAQQGKRMLREAYDTFTEGHATADLTDAAALLR